MTTNSINKIDDLNKIDNKYSSNLSKPKLTINFDESSVDIFNNFIFEHQNLKLIYVEKNYQVNLDLVDYDFKIYLFFIDCVEKSHDYIYNSKYHDLKLFGNIYSWNFCIVQNVMFNFPFTLSDIIYIPVQYIKDNYNNDDYTSLTRTIIHEKLHIGQRLDEEIWTKYINNTDSNWIKINKSDEKFNIIENNLLKNKTNLINNREEFIYNPDTYYKNFKYLYKIDNKLYYGHYVYNSDNKKISIRYFELSEEKKILVGTNKKFEQEHPYEKYAYSISENIV
jgi:hypothetical protein